MTKNTGKKELLKLLLLFVAALLVGTVSSIAVSIFIGVQLHMGELGVVTAVSSLVMYASVIVILIVYSKRHGENFWKECRFNRIKASTVLLSLLLGVVFRPMVIFLNSLSQLIVPDTSAQLADLLLQCSVLLFFFSPVLFAPICEEIIMRGFFHNRFEKNLSFASAAILSGFCFGVFHLNLNQFVFAWLAGIVLAYVYKASGSIYASIIVHMVNNAISCITMFLKYIKNKEQGLSLAEASEINRGDMLYMTRVLLIYGALSIVSFFLVRIIIKKIAKNESKHIKTGKG